MRRIAILRVIVSFLQWSFLIIMAHSLIVYISLFFICWLFVLLRNRLSLVRYIFLRICVCACGNWFSWLMHTLLFSFSSGSCPCAMSAQLSSILLTMNKWEKAKAKLIWFQQIDMVSALCKAVGWNFAYLPLTLARWLSTDYVRHAQYLKCITSFNFYNYSLKQALKFPFCKWETSRVDRSLNSRTAIWIKALFSQMCFIEHSQMRWILEKFIHTPKYLLNKWIESWELTFIQI